MLCMNHGGDDDDMMVINEFLTYIGFILMENFRFFDDSRPYIFSEELLLKGILNEIRILQKSKLIDCIIKTRITEPEDVHSYYIDMYDAYSTI